LINHIILFINKIKFCSALQKISEKILNSIKKINITNILEVIKKYKKRINIVKIYIQIIGLKFKIYMSKSSMYLFNRCLSWNLSIFV